MGTHLTDADLNVPHFVYRCFSADDTLLYVGSARDVETRMGNHLDPCNRGKEPNGTLRRHMARYTAEEYPTKLAARAAERHAIATEAPLVNKQHNPARFRKAEGGVYALVQPVHPITAEAFDFLPTERDAS